MSEAFDSGAQGVELTHARILEIRTDRQGPVEFVIGGSATSEDVLATLRYIEPDEENIQNYLCSIFAHAVETQDILGNIRIPVEHSAIEIAPNVTIEQELVFGDGATIKDVTTAFEAIYGKDKGPMQLGKLALTLIDYGLMAGTVVRGPLNNELLSPDPELIELEMQSLTERFYES